LRLYVGLFGNDYGFEDAAGVSPTEREFDAATASGKYRLIYVKGADDATRKPKMRALIGKAQGQLIRKRFATTAELVGGLYAALIEYLEQRDLIRSGPFDAAPCAKATMADLDEERIQTFLRRARRARGFPLPDEATAPEVLTHLNLLNDGRLTNAAVLLFGRRPQRLLISSEVKCAHFRGPGPGLRDVQDQPVGGDAGRERPGARGLPTVPCRATRCSRNPCT
jgi:ATP-dependent DNA helicase RecG